MTTGGGLKVVYCYTREDASLTSSYCTLLLSLSNMRETAMRRIRIVAANAADHSKVIPFPEIALIEAGATVEARLVLDDKVGVNLQYTFISLPYYTTRSPHVLFFLSYFTSYPTHTG